MDNRPTDTLGMASKVSCKRALCNGDLMYLYVFHFNLYISVTLEALSSPPFCPQARAYFPLGFCYP